jgi:hypothetical protein
MSGLVKVVDKKAESFVLNSENLNRNDCCGLPLHKTMSRWLSE